MSDGCRFWFMIIFTPWRLNPAFASLRARMSWSIAIWLAAFNLVFAITRLLLK